MRIESCSNELEDAEDLKTLRAMRKRPLRFRKLEDFLKDSAGV